MDEPFSVRYGFDNPNKEIIYNDAPEALRVLIIKIIMENMGKNPSFLRGAICSVLLCRENPSNWTPYPNVYNEATDLIHSAPWYNIYDLIEKLAEILSRHGEYEDFADRINRGFARLNIGWQLKNMAIQFRGDDGFEATFQEAVDSIEKSGFNRAKNEIKEALADLAKRPEPDINGSARHSIGALESVAREIEKKYSKTLGEILKENPDLFPPPLNDALSKIWGFSSEYARHVREDRQIERSEAILLLGLVSSLITYLINKKP